jgi:hypothetical protein
MGGRQIVLVSTAGFSVLDPGIFWREAKTKRLFSQCTIRIPTLGGVHYNTFSPQTETSFASDQKKLKVAHITPKDQDAL